MADPRETLPVAIVGVGCRFPGGANGPEAFWRLLVEGQSGIREIPPDRWSIERYYHPDPGIAASMVTKWGGFVEGVDAFDPHFWSISPREAVRMDPQQRWLLEMAWEAIEDSGVAPSRLRGTNVGVFVGISANDYGGLQVPNLEAVDAYTNSGSTLSIASNRISYMLDLKGPSMSIDTACSSSAVAVWLACQSLREGQCVAALVGGVNAVIAPHTTLGFSKAAMLSPTGQCFAFDARANGYVRGEGAGMVVLKPLAAALADGDRIYAVIRGASVNQDGHTSSMTVPSTDGQAAMLRQAYRQAGISPGRVVYVEAHGTGTPVGDPIEATALGRVLTEGRPAGSPCLIGSVKTNIGHLEAGSGIAGLIKTALILHHRTIPPSLNYATANPSIAFGTLGLAVAARLQPLPTGDDGTAVAGVNSFGFGGTNAHVVLETAPPAAPGPRTREPRAERPCLLPISARDEAALARAVEAHGELLEATPHTLAEICATAGARREHHAHRLAVIGGSVAEVRTRLAGWRRDGTAEGVVIGRSVAGSPLVFVFTGQGPQWWGMGRQLLEREPRVRQTLEAIDAHFEPLAGWSLLGEMRRSEAESRMSHTDVAQPAIFALQVSLVELWRSWGVSPSLVIGHSVGEVAAAYTAGAYSLEEVVRVIFHRSRLQHRTLGDGRMIAAAVSAEEARRAIEAEEGRVEIAAINSPHLVTLAGEASGLERIAERLERGGVFVRWLRIPYAFHSRAMDPIREDLLSALADLAPRSSTVPFVSTVTGRPLDTKWLDADYWWDNVRRPVLLAPAVDALLRAGEHAFLEIGPHPSLETSLKESVAERGRTGVVLHSLRRESDESREMLTALATLHVLGTPVDWCSVNQSEAPPLGLPAYPWGRESFWLESRASAEQRLTGFVHPLLGQRVDAALPTWQHTLDLRRLPYLGDHRIWDGVVLPAAAYAEMAAAVARLLFPHERHAVEELEISRALFVDPAAPPAVQVVFDPDDTSVRIYGAAAAREAWELHGQATLRRLAPGSPPAVDLDAIRGRLHDHFAHDRFYAELAIRGFAFGPAFRQTRQMWRVPGEALTEIAVDEAFRAGGYALHPALLDACLQAVLGTRVAAAHERPEDDLLLPDSIRAVRLHTEQVPARLWAHARLTAAEARALQADIAVYDDGGRRVADLLGVLLVRAEVPRAGAELDEGWYRFEWEARALDADSAGAAPAVETKRYALLADAHGVAEHLARRLAALGHQTLALPDEASIDAGVDGIIHCGALDAPAAAGMDLDSLRAAQQRGTLSAFRLLRALADRAVPVWFVTRNAQPVLPGDRVEGLAAASLVGLLRVAANERQGRIALLDLDACSPEEAAAHIAGEVTRPAGGETETAYRGGLRHALRLRPARADDLPQRTTEAVGPGGTVAPYRLQIEKPGVLTNLALHAVPRPAPGPGELEIRVHAGGINFRDVMKALGTYPGRAADLRWLGDDIAGVIERVGERVQGLRPGDRVAGVAPYAFRSHALTDPRLVLPMPAGVSFAEAATLPTVFLTAHYALRHLARMRPGESILIHAATGGVGQAAIQVARQLGLEIFATAGTPEKRRLLREQGVRHVLDSRTLAFADEVLEITEGRGVDAVLNSLAGDFIAKGLAVLAPFGRFLEIGKADIYRNTKLGLRPLRNNIAYLVVDLVQLLQSRRDVVAQLLGEIAAHLEAGDYRAIPFTSFPATQAAEAFRFMAQGKHVGKNVLRFDLETIPVGPCTEPAHRFDAEASYLVTGGAGGVGLEVAKWLARGGARRLVLMSRSGPRDAAACAELDALRASGVTVVDARADVTRRADVERVVAETTAAGRPLRGVFHAAMVLDDDALLALDEARMTRVMEPKIAGAWNLHVATRACPLDHFVCFSSFSAVCGAPRQASYDAANTFLDALAHHRRAAGLPALSVNWGTIAGAGFLERTPKTAEYLARVGIRPFQVREALEILDRLLRLDAAQVVVARVDWSSLARLILLVATSPTYAAVTRAGRTNEGGRSLAARLAAAEAGERAPLVEDFIVTQVGEVFGLPDAKLDRRAPLTSLGLDSLMTVELVNRMESLAGIRIPMATLFAGPSVEELARTVLKLMAAARPAEAEVLEPATVGAAQEAAAAPAEDAGHVVILRSAAGRGPLFLFHPVGGGVTVYAQLARHVTTPVALYGIESRLMRGAEQEYAGIDAMVCAYAAAVREAAPPPYRLFGFSLGGYLAARVAEVLEGDAAAVELVGVVEWDARPPLTPGAQADRLRQLTVATYRFLERELGAVRSLTDRRLERELAPLVEQVMRDGPQRSDIFLRWAVDRGLIVGDTLQWWAQQYLAAFGQHCAMLAAGLPRPRLRAPLALWRASDGFGSGLPAWQHAGQALEHVIEGDHFAFLRPPGVRVLAKQLDAILASAPPAAGAPHP